MDWRDFLTEQDKLVLASTRWTKDEPFGLGTRPALLVVDDYYAALGLPRAPILEAIQHWPSACGEDGWLAIDRTRPVLDAAREAGAPIFYFTSAPRGVRWSRGTQHRVSSDAVSPDPRAIVDELSPQDGDVIIEKVGPSGFYASALDFQLRALDCDTVLICGEATSGCVRATAMDAYVRGYKVGVITDCCFDRIQASHWMSLFDLGQKYADLIDSVGARALLGA
jgi:maleamate amidohydrolase